MKPPFIPLSSDNTRSLLRTCHERDPACLPGLVLPLFFGLTPTQSAVATWEQFPRYEHRFELPTRDKKIEIRGPGWAWLEFYRPKKTRFSDPVCSLSPRDWAARFRRLAPGYPVGALRRSFLYYQSISDVPMRADPRIPISEDPRIELLRFSLLHPSNFLPALDPPIFRQPITQVEPTSAPMTHGQLNLV